MEFSSKLLERAVAEVALLPGIGKRTALRLVMHLLKQPESQTEHLISALKKLRTEINYCSKCYNLSDLPTCEICANTMRSSSVVCVVEDVRDVMAIENTAQFKGVYHVLGGKISPMDGIGPNDLRIEPLIERLQREKIEEVIFALSATMEGDTTNFYIYKQIKHLPLKISTIARGIGVNDEIEFADEITLGRSIIHRVPFDNTTIT